MDRHLIVFVKAPEPGEVKTRLQKRYTPEQAAAIYRAFIKDMLVVGEAVECEHRGVCFAPPESGSMVRALAGAAWESRPQAEGDLGERMVRAFDEILRYGASRVLLVGSDIPSIPPAILSRAFVRLDDCDLVLGPSTDGGYYLIGLSKPMPELFDGLTWGSSQVFRETLDRAEQIHARIGLMPPWYDVDTPEELDFLVSHVRGERLSGGVAGAPETMRVLGEIERSRPGRRV